MKLYSFGLVDDSILVTNDGMFIPMFGLWNSEGYVSTYHIRTLLSALRDKKDELSLASASFEPQPGVIEVVLTDGRKFRHGVTTLISKALVDFAAANKAHIDAFQKADFDQKAWDDKMDNPIYEIKTSEDLIPFEINIIKKTR